MRHIGIGFVTMAAASLFLAAPVLAGAALPPDGRVTLDQLKQRYNDAGSRYALIGGVSVRYKDEGRGPVIVLMHGSYGSLDQFDQMTARLKARYRIIRFDLPGMGLSETRVVDKASGIAYGDDVLKALLDKLGIDKVIFAGTSSGGAIGYWFAARFPERVTALILSNTPADPVFNDKVPVPDYLATEIARTDKSGFRDLRFWDTDLRWLAGDPNRYSSAWIQRVYDMNRRQPTPGAPFWFRSTRDPVTTQAAIAKVRAPTLLIWGLRDGVLTPATMDALKSYLKAAPVSSVVFSDVGHYPILEVPDRSAALIEGWLAGIGQTR